MGDYTPTEIVDMIIIYGSCGQNARKTARQYRDAFPHRRHPNYNTILSLIARAREGNLNRKRSKKLLDENNILNLAVLGMVIMNPQISQRQISRELNTALGTVNKILRANNFHPYHISLHQALSDRDKQMRITFCNWALQQIERDPQFFLYVMFSDEATFKSDGTLNRHNCHYYSQNNPYWTRHVDHQHIWKINVWCGILNGHIVGPYFFDGNVTGAKYLHMLQHDLQEMLEDINLETVRRMWLQQDGAAPHYSRVVTQYLNGRFQNRWIGRGGFVAWPPRSPDLTSPDFFLWGYLKGFVFANAPNTPEDMKERIREACLNISEQVIRKTTEAFERRLHLCLQENGGVFEQLL